MSSSRKRSGSSNSQLPAKRRNDKNEYRYWLVMYVLYMGGIQLLYSTVLTLTKPQSMQQLECVGGGSQ